MLATTCFSPALPRILFPPSFRSDSTPLHLSSHKPRAPITATSTGSQSSLLSEPSSDSNAAINLRTAPWTKTPLYLQPLEEEGVDLAKPERSNGSDGHGGKKRYRALADRRNVKTGKYAMRRIAKSIEKLQKNGDSGETGMKLEEVEFGDFYLEGFDESRTRGRMPWEKDDGIVLRRPKKKTVTSAELSLDKVLLERLRGEASKMEKWVKVNKIGVTQDVVNKIHFTWETNELAMLKFDVPLSRNMDRAREIVEMKTGGMVVWSKKNALVVFRGCNYPLGLKLSTKMQVDSPYCSRTPFLETDTDFSLDEHDEGGSNRSINDNVDEWGEASTSFLSGSLYERETDRLLDDLGPRFIDWWMHKPLPVDADMLPEVVPGYMPPYRRCPPFTNPKLTDAELLYLRKLAHPLPTHFVLGRNRKLQGLAAAILKLWEKSLIAKIALKWGVPNTNNEQMAYELKSLTGGTLLLRNKFFIILYRGKDFLPVGVANSIIQRETELQRWQLHEENSRLKASELFCFDTGNLEERAKAGTLSDFKDITMEYEDLTTGSTESKLQADAEKGKIIRELKKQERRLSILDFKVEKSTKELTKLNASCRHVEPDADQELITNEERICFRKMGLKMHSCLTLGRRGIFDGVIEGLHQHWKHREVVKVISMQRAFNQVLSTAKSLEAESGGILISVDKLKEGYAIIIFRGKNYKRPLRSVSKNLLTKGKALRRSLEIQRIGSLKFFANQKWQKVSELQLELENVHDSGE
ncbi:chloroplastic group IIA intron splicing facilitator CRS1, chloroplastic isoform X1 [Cucurbita pepo subsp. pepo]|uniref:chloroplastic group IIA intron splicing facilitator CRS1, chloroplastic isoform X1 n=1 Tax=Cucurbita pepo subsp. pepo TaxID=3664 RepID=UPI000C9D87BE|nr:chloroplastic group IIA intron splicing facilitator CRS1, chloroplastic isoform X1 [Cucurbita pepo subsp. pepo]XP_023551203.1 chloroplastic group IIA intron splicing facilitator CRS1, chloroplastic isoform X1 [Cucurbita pepo subsp. pepo]